jgi:type VI secretion system secreted protein VgrG
MPDGAISQKNRLGKYHSPIGADALALLRFRGDEGVNTLGQFRVEALSPSGGIDLDSVVGLHGTVEIGSLNHGPRFYDGIITEAEVVDRRLDGWLYALTMRPWFWLCSLRRNQRIFHNKTAPQIISEVLNDYEFQHRPALVKTYDPIEYTVQYGESDLAFVSRMMERHGISYHFEHALKSHVMVLTDAMDCFKPAPGGSREFQAVTGQHRYEREHFNVWSLARKVTTGRVRLTDYNFKTPTAAMPVDQTGGATHAQGEIESFDYPGIYLAQTPGKAVVRMRADGERGPDGLFHAGGDTASLSPGMLVTLTDHPEAALNGKAYLLTRAEHQFDAEGYASGTTLTEGDSYKGTYRFHPDKKPFLPAIQTPLSHILGPQTAVVVGEGEIDCDEYGRILVRFHWDLKDAYSMRCRVAQIWAGNAWGGMVIPRIGMEVLVEFLEGDPDKPLVTGCVYNGKNKVPYPLPEHKTTSTFKTNTHQGNGFNELRFEDERGQQEIYMHAERDFNRVVRRDDLENIGRSKYTEAAKDLMVSVGRNSVHEARGVAEISGGRGVSIQGGPSGLSPKFFEAAIASHQMVFDRQKFSLLAMASAASSGGVTITADTAVVNQAGLTRLTFTGQACQTVVGKDKLTHVGRLHQMISGGTTVIASADNTTVESGDRIDIVCGKSSIRLHADGTIELDGVHIKATASKIDMN